MASSVFAQEKADTLYIGGTIITVNDEAPRAKAVAVRNGLILAVGTQERLDPGRRNRQRTGQVPWQ
jgi:predicted amidohydrolase YtcJ